MDNQHAVLSCKLRSIDKLIIAIESPKDARSTSIFEHLVPRRKAMVPIWVPTADRVANAAVTDLMAHFNAKLGRSIHDYAGLHNQCA